MNSPPSTPRAQVAFGASVAAVYGVLMSLHVVFGLFFSLVIVCGVRGTWLWLRSTGWNPASAFAPAGAVQRDLLTR